MVVHLHHDGEHKVSFNACRLPHQKQPLGETSIAECLSNHKNVSVWRFETRFFFWKMPFQIIKGFSFEFWDQVAPHLFGSFPVQVLVVEILTQAVLGGRRSRASAWHKAGDAWCAACHFYLLLLGSILCIGHPCQINLMSETALNIHLSGWPILS